MLVGQFVRSAFVSSGRRPLSAGVRRRVGPDRGLPRGPGTPRGAPLLTALGLRSRRGLARDDDRDARSSSTAPRILDDELGLDPLEFRLVCVPQDLYSRFGRDRGWGSRAAMDAFRRLPGDQGRPAAGARRRRRALRRAQRPRQHRAVRPARLRDRALRRRPSRAPSRALALSREETMGKKSAARKDEPKARGRSATVAPRRPVRKARRGGAQEASSPARTTRGS